MHNLTRRGNENFRPLPKLFDNPLTTDSRSVWSLFDDVFGGNTFTDLINTSGRTGELGKVNVMDYPDKLEMRVNVAGFPKDNIEIKVLNGQLTVTGQLEENTLADSPEKEGQYLYQEMPYYNRKYFSRTFSLGNQFNEDGITAEFDNGILTLVLPKISSGEDSNVKRIEIK